MIYIRRLSEKWKRKNLLANIVLENQDPSMIAISVDQDQDEIDDQIIAIVNEQRFVFLFYLMDN
jgi:hypothetical protein